MGVEDFPKKGDYIVARILDDEGSLEFVEYGELGTEQEELDEDVSEILEDIEFQAQTPLKKIDTKRTLVYDGNWIRTLMKKYNLEPGSKIRFKVEVTPLVDSMETVEEIFGIGEVPKERPKSGPTIGDIIASYEPHEEIIDLEEDVSSLKDLLEEKDELEEINKKLKLLDLQKRGIQKIVEKLDRAGADNKKKIREKFIEKLDTIDECIDELIQEKSKIDEAHLD